MNDEQKITSIVDLIKNLTLTECNELCNILKKEFNLEDINIASVSKTEEIQSEKYYNVILKSIGSNKVAAMKTIKDVLECSLQEAKTIAETPNYILLENKIETDCKSFEKSFLDKDYKEIVLEIKPC